MKKIILITVIVLFNTFTACKYSHKIQNADENMISIPTEYIETTIDTDLQTSQRKTEIVTTSPNYPEDEVIKAYEEIATESPLYFGDMFYDLDLDGVPEYIKASGEKDDSILNKIYKYINGKVVEVGEFTTGGFWNDWNVTSGLTKYYNADIDEYFYVSESDVGDKLINYESELMMFYLKNDKLIKTTIATCNYKIISTDGATNSHIDVISNTFLGKDNTPIGMQKVSDMSCYYDGVKEYLSQFTKIEEIEMGNVLISPFNNTYDNLYYNYYIKSHEDNN